jgi:hypothetical protein
VTGPQVADAVPVGPVTVGVTVTAFAEAPGVAAVLRTFAMSVTVWAALMVKGGCAANATVSVAADRIVVAGEVVARPVIAVPVPADVPFAVAVKASVPAPDTVHENA